MAKSRNFTSRGETGFGDPLGDEYTENFNIIQFITGDTPIDSPVTPSCGNGTQQQLPQLSHFVTNNNGSFNGNGPNTQVTANMMYQDPRPTFPESPPITDISGGGSSGSPSSSSDAPYSPDGYYDNQNDVNMSTNQLIHDLAMQPQNGRGLHLNHFPHVGYGYQPHTQVPPHLLNHRQMPNYMVPHDMLGNVFARDGCTPITDIQSKKRPLPMTGMQPHIKTEAPPAKQFALHQNNVMTPMTPAHMEEEPEEPCVRKSIHNINDDASNRFKFSRFQEASWQTLYDSNQRPLHLDVKVVADKGFNYSQTDSCFVNQKKNHFQITVNIEAIDSNPPRYVKINGQLKEVAEFKLVFCGVKNEMTTSEVQIKQSQTDRKPLPHEPVLVEIQERKRTKVTVPRLHFSETTMNNHRKHGRPNPEQKFFLLIVRLVAKTLDNDNILIQSYQSERVIVRASNPGQFEPPEAESTWQRNGSGDLYYKGSVAIGAEHANANATLHVNGSMFVAGDVVRASDRNLKTDIYNISTQEALERIQNLRIVGYSYKPEIAEEWGLNETNRHRVGVIAQELAEVLPDAVRHGEYLTVDETRIFFDTVAAAQELYRLTGQLEGKIDKVEKIWRNKLGESRSLSVSRASLSPSMKSLWSSKSKEPKEKDIPRRCTQECHHNKLLCSSKITQGTIVTLVFVMAICMLAMSVLYCMDWYHRSWFNGFNPALPPVEEPPHSDLDNLIIDSGIPVSWIPLKPPKPPVFSAFCTQDRQLCREGCCANTTTTLRGEIAPEIPDHLLIPPLKEGVDPRPPNGVPISITVVNSNTTIDESYCVGGSCTNYYGRYTLYVPLHSSALTVPLTMKIKIGHTENLQNCGPIEDYSRLGCSKVKSDYEHSTRLDMDTLNEYTFRLSGAKYTQSAFQFRVGRVTTLCNVRDDLMGTTFDEYNIIFYRQCQSSAAY